MSPNKQIIENDPLWNVIRQLQDGLGAICRDQAEDGNEKAKAVISNYGLVYTLREPASEAIFITSFNDWKSELESRKR